MAGAAAAGAAAGTTFGQEIIVFAMFYMVFLHFRGWAPSEEGPGSMGSCLDLVLVMTPFGAGFFIFARFYKGFPPFWGPFRLPPRMLDTQGDPRKLSPVKNPFPFFAYERKKKYLKWANG